MKNTDKTTTTQKARIPGVDPLVRFNYLPRVSGFIMHGVILSTLFYGSRNMVLWSAIFLQAIVWPQVAFYIGKHSQHGRRSEYKNLLFEAFL